MIPHQPRELLPSPTQFTFSNPIQKPENDLNDPNGIEYNTWAQKIKGQRNNYFGRPGNAKLGAWTRRGGEEKEDFKWLVKRKDDDESDTPSPELWKKPESPVIHSAESSPVRGRGFSHISHSSRAQTIEKYRQAMLELVQDIPETAFELSLRDIAESPKITTPLQVTVEENSEEGKEGKTKTKTKKKGKKEKKMERRISRSESMDTGGLLLKMFIPRIPSVFGRRRRRSSGNIADACGKVSPKPMLGDGEKSGSEKSTDRECWSSSSMSSSGSSGRRRSGKLSGCYSFLRTRDESRLIDV